MPIIKNIHNIHKMRKTACLCGFLRADNQTRTDDLILTKDALYLLSYTSIIFGSLYREPMAIRNGIEPSTSSVTG